MLRAINRCGLVLGVALLSAGTDYASGAAPILAAESADDSDRVVIDTKSQQRLHIGVRLLAKERYLPTARAIATAVDIAPWLQLRAEATSADAAAHASAAQMLRIQQLLAADHSASPQEYEAARMQFDQDQARAHLAHNQLQAQWGGPLGRIGDERMAAALAGGGQTLLRIEPLLPLLVEPDWTQLQISGPVTAKISSSASAWRAPNASNSAQTPAWFLIVRTAQRWPSGLRTEFALPLSNEALIGTTVPSSAVVIADGATWVFVQQDATHFQRRKIDRSRPLPSGYFVTEQFAPGESVVVSGAGLLLAELVGTSIADED